MDNEALIAVKEGDLEMLKQRIDDGINIDAQDDNGWTLLYHAASKGHAKVIECLLRNGADVLLTTHKNNTALHIAAMKSDHSLVETILENVAREKLRQLLDMKTKATGTAALHVAAKNDSFGDGLMMLIHGANFEIRNQAGERPSDLAIGQRLPHSLNLIRKAFGLIKSDCGDVAQRMLQEIKGALEDLCLNAPSLLGCREDQDRTFNADLPLLNCRDDEGRTFLQVLLLHHAKSASELCSWLRQCVRPLQRDCESLHDPGRRSEVDALAMEARQSRELWSKTRQKTSLKEACRALGRAHAVMRAFRKFHERMTSIVIDVNLKILDEVIEVLGFEPKERYEEDRYYENLPTRWKNNLDSFLVIMEIIYASIDGLITNLTSVQLFNAVKDDDLNRVQRLLDDGAPTDTFDHKHSALLYHAIDNASEKMIELLLQSRAKLGCADCYGKSPLYLAVDKGLPAKIVRMILEKATYVNIPKFIDGCTALHLAAKKGRLDLLKVSLEFGANYEAQDKEGRSPLEVSTNKEVSDFLKLVDELFGLAEEPKDKFENKMKLLSSEDFQIVNSARNQEGKTISTVVVEANAKRDAAVKETSSSRMEFSL